MVKADGVMATHRPLKAVLLIGPPPRCSRTRGCDKLHYPSRWPPSSGLAIVVLEQPAESLVALHRARGSRRALRPNNQLAAEPWCRESCASSPPPNAPTPRWSPRFLHPMPTFLRRARRSNTRHGGICAAYCWREPIHSGAAASTSPNRPIAIARTAASTTLAHVLCLAMRPCPRVKAIGEALPRGQRFGSTGPFRDPATKRSYHLPRVCPTG